MRSSKKGKENSELSLRIPAFRNWMEETGNSQRARICPKLELFTFWHKPFFFFFSLPYLNWCQLHPSISHISQSKNFGIIHDSSLILALSHLLTLTLIPHSVYEETMLDLPSELSRICHLLFWQVSPDYGPDHRNLSSTLLLTPLSLVLTQQPDVSHAM